MQLSLAGRQEYGLRHMTAEQLRYLGRQQVAYLKVGIRNDDKQVFMVFGADGMPLGGTDEFESAVEMAIENGLRFVNVH